MNNNFNFVVKILFAGFLNGLTLGRKARYVNKSKHFYRLQYNSKQRPSETERRIRFDSNEKE